MVTIYSDLRQDVTESGVLEEAKKISDSHDKYLHEVFDVIGSKAFGYMTGDVEQNQWNMVYIPAEGILEDNPDFFQAIKVLAEKAAVIYDKKGFLYRPFLYSSGEHRDVGSTGFESYSGEDGEYRNIPIPLVKKILNIEDDRDVTLEQIKRARALQGMPTIDENGFIIDKVIKRDSYDFLDSEIVDSVKEEELEIKVDLENVSSEILNIYSALMNDFIAKVNDYLKDAGEGDERISTPFLISLAPKIKDRNGYIDFNRLVINAKGVAFGVGYRDRILTPQELAFAGRYGDEHQGLDPHIPLGIQRDEIDTDLASTRRGEEKFFTIYTGMFTGFESPATISLEPLGDNSRTVQGPQLVSSDTGETSEKLTNFYKEKFSELPEKAPFTREGDWFFKE